MRTKVGIVGAGPAGLMLSHLLHLEGIASIIVEDRSRAYCEARVRAGLMENWVAKMLIDTGVGERLRREAMVHDGIYISFRGEARHIDFKKLIGKQVFIYDQKEVVTDLIAKRLSDGGQILFWMLEDNGERRLAVVDADGKDQPKKLANQEGSRYNTDAEWSPDGKRIIFCSDREFAEK